MLLHEHRREEHPLRLEHYLILNKHPEFACAAREKKHLGEPITDPREHSIENDINLMLNGRYGTLTSMLGNFDAHLPVLMRGSRFVFSPNGVGEQCYREYEALVAGTYPLVDASSNKHRNAILDLLPVVRVEDWSTVTPIICGRRAGSWTGHGFHTIFARWVRPAADGAGARVICVCVFGLVLVSPDCGRRRRRAALLRARHLRRRECLPNHPAQSRVRSSLLAGRFLLG